MILSVHYRGREIGKLADDPASGRIYFEFDASWINEGLNLSPFHLPLRPGLQENPDPAFRGLPGLFFDSLPDAWGLGLMERRFRERGIPPERIPTLAMLSYLGTRAMGALSYHPDSEEKTSREVLEAVELAKLDREARKVVSGSSRKILPLLMSAGSSAGGARPKVLVSMQGDKLIQGAGEVPQGFEGWIVKLATPPAGLPDEKQYGRIEYAYSCMAKDAGIAVPETRLIIVDLEKRPVGFFASKRFDRRPGQGEAQKVHVHSLAGLCHLDFNRPDFSYSDLLRATWNITRDARQVKKAFRQMVFNGMALNCDDHAKNFAFVMNDQGEWSLSPAYDMTFSTGRGQAAVHALLIHGVRERPGMKDYLAVAQRHSISPMESKEIIEQVWEAVIQWPKHAKVAGVSKARAAEIFSQIKR